ncbi:MAG: biosynthetic arginine decarboxylase [Acidobacteria bacterium]|nr:biosynthetic arginine decarboxylase [Acidobacteriota bacterium]
MTDWDREEATSHYKIEEWGLGYFTVNEAGNLCVSPSKDAPYKVDLKLLVDELRARKVQPPILIRVLDILKDRINEIANCFKKAIDDYEYSGTYYPLYPIKVNQQRHVVEAMLEYGRPHGLGLEAGSKAELLAVLALTEDPSIPIVCNGYKDNEFVELVGMAHKMGKFIFPVIEKYSELESFIRYYKETGTMPNLGIRIKLNTRGSGQWAKTGGDDSKFGLRIPEVVDAIERLKQENLLSHLKLLHFHIGSQVTQITVIKQAINEAGRVFVEMSKMGAELAYLDVGGGLGVDYDGSTRDTFSTINYTIQEYANDVVYRVQQLCLENKIPCPTIFSESGRYLTAHYSMLITNIATTGVVYDPSREDTPVSSSASSLNELQELVNSINESNYLECYHDALQYRTDLMNLFHLGYLSLTERAAMESTFNRLMDNVIHYSHRADQEPVELMDLDRGPIDTYFANFSLFQSLPDAWAINQVFPIVPIHRLNERPERRAVLVDLTCDSDGIIREYIGDDDENPFVKLHAVNPNEPYYVGIFMIGAYQETLGELHNLFGDTHAIQIDIQGENQYRIASFIKGDTVNDVLGYVSYSHKDLIHRMRHQIEKAVESRMLTLDESALLMDQYEQGMYGYTYFED